MDIDNKQFQGIQQKLAPQLIQSLRILHLPTADLTQLIQQELEINPLLEIDEDVDLDLAQEEPEAEQATDEQNEEPLEELEFDEPDLDTLDTDLFDEQDWDHYLNESGYASPRERI